MSKPYGLNDDEVLAVPLMQQPIWLIYAEGETSKGCVVHCGALGKTGAPLWTEFLQGDKDFISVVNLVEPISVEHIFDANHRSLRGRNSAVAVVIAEKFAVFISNFRRLLV